MTPVTPLWFVVLPFFDMTTVMIRRIRNKRHPFAADRDHLHHLFLATGFSVAQTVLILTAVALVLASAGIAGLYLGVPENAMLALYLGLFAGYYYLVMHSWARMRFLGRQICRGVEQEQGVADDVRPDIASVGIVTQLLESKRERLEQHYVPAASTMTAIDRQPGNPAKPLKVKMSGRG